MRDLTGSVPLDINQHNTEAGHPGGPLDGALPAPTNYETKDPNKSSSNHLVQWAHHVPPVGSVGGQPPLQHSAQCNDGCQDVP